MDVLSIIGLGITAGAVSAVSFGPSFLILTQTSYQKGFFQGICVALGISASDIMYVVLIFLGFSKIVTEFFESSFLSGFAGIILLIVGLNYLLIRVSLDQKQVKTRRGWLSNIVKGFIVNSLNPYVPLYWTAIVAAASSQMSSSTFTTLFFAATLVTLLAFDVLKARLSFSATKISRLNYKLVYRVAGGILILFGIRLIFSAVADLNMVG